MTDRRLSAAHAIEERAAADLKVLRTEKGRLAGGAPPDLDSCPPALVAVHYRARQDRAAMLKTIEAEVARARADLSRAIARRRAIEAIVEKEAETRRTALRRRIARTPDPDD